MRNLVPRHTHDAVESIGHIFPFLSDAENSCKLLLMGLESSSPLVRQEKSG